jgi:hypothetical protein
MNFKTALYERMVTLMTLNTNLESELFGGTIFLAAMAAARSIGLDEELAREMAMMAVGNTIHDIQKTRADIRAALKGHKHETCGNKDCAGCRLHAWANSTPADQSNAKKEPNYEELLRRSRNGPVN